MTVHWKNPVKPAVTIDAMVTANVLMEFFATNTTNAKLNKILEVNAMAIITVPLDFASGVNV
jgi:hypothetical protein